MHLAPIHPTRLDIENVAISLAVHLGRIPSRFAIPKDGNAWQKVIKGQEGRPDTVFRCEDGETLSIAFGEAKMSCLIKSKTIFIPMDGEVPTGFEESVLFFNIGISLSSEFERVIDRNN